MAQSKAADALCLTPEAYIDDLMSIPGVSRDVAMEHTIRHFRGKMSEDVLYDRLKGRYAAKVGHKFTVKEKVLGLGPGTYEVVETTKQPEYSGPWGDFSETTVKGEDGKTYSIPTGNAQAMGLLPMGRDAAKASFDSGDPIKEKTFGEYRVLLQTVRFDEDGVTGPWMYEVLVYTKGAGTPISKKTRSQGPAEEVYNQINSEEDAKNSLLTEDDIPDKNASVKTADISAPSEDELTHEEMRITTMTDDQLRTRMDRIGKPQKMYNFAIVLRDAGKKELEKEAWARLLKMGYDKKGKAASVKLAQSFNESPVRMRNNPGKTGQVQQVDPTTGKFKVQWGDGSVTDEDFGNIEKTSALSGRHELIVDSLDDGKAHCSADDWSMAYTGALTEDEITKEFEKHIMGKKSSYYSVVIAGKEYYVKNRETLVPQPENWLKLLDYAKSIVKDNPGMMFQSLLDAIAPFIPGNISPGMKKDLQKIHEGRAITKYHSVVVSGVKCHVPDQKTLGALLLKAGYSEDQIVGFYDKNKIDEEPKDKMAAMRFRLSTIRGDSNAELVK